jgi:hypothetical protein
MPNMVAVKPHTEPGTELVSIRPDRRNARPHFMGAVSLKTVTVTADGITGEMLEEWSEARELDASVLKHFTRIFHTDRGWHTFHGKGNKRVPVTGNTYRAAYVCGSEFYVA